MKKLFLLLIISFVLMVDTSAQEYRKFKVGMGSGFTIAPNTKYGSYTGIHVALEPMYHINDDLALGLRLEFADIEFDPIWGGGRPISSYALNSQYYFGKKKFRPTVGAGIGLFVITSYSYIDTDYSLNKFGFYPRAGFELGHFYMTMEYNVIPSSPSGYSSEFNDNYFGMRFGVVIGGGRKTSSGNENSDQ